MKITMLRRDIWLGGATNTAYRAGKTYDVEPKRRDYFVGRGSAVDFAQPKRRGRRAGPPSARDDFATVYRGDPVDDAAPAGK